MVRFVRVARLPAVLLLGLLTAACGRSPVLVFDDGLLDDDEEALDPEEDPVMGGCRKVDYLFVIDNSASMLTHQQRLVQSFGIFIDGVEQTQASLESVHLGVVSTDTYSGNVDNPDASCLAIGGLITTTQGHNSSEAQCGPYEEGHDYMTEADDLSVTFPCAAQVGTTGNNEERPLDALTSAVIDLDQPGLCNDGFIRDDALLVVVIVSDEDDPGMSGSFDRIVEAKGGRQDNVVVVGLVNEPGTECPLTGHATEALVLTEFISKFTYGFVAPVCGDYQGTFQQAIAVVEEACSDE